MRFLAKSLMGILLLSLTVGLLAWAGQSVRQAVEARMAEGDRQRPARERVFAVNVVPFEPSEIAPVLTVFGELRSRKTLEVRAPAAGNVVDISDSFEEGGRVAAGDLLIQIDPADAMATLAGRRIDVAEAEAERRDAERSLSLAREDLAAAEAQTGLRTKALNRQRDLLQRGVGTEASVEAAELAEASARQAVVSRKSALAQAEARVDQAKTREARQKINQSEAERAVADTKLFAEFDGTLSSVNVIRGGLVNKNERLAQLIDPQSLEVTFRLSAAQYARLLDDAGQLQDVTLDVTLDVFGVDVTAKGRVSRESAAVAEGQTGRLIFASLEKAAGMRPGDFVTVKIVEPTLQRVAKLPSTAVNAAGKILVVGDGDRLEEAEVTVLRRQGDDVILRGRGLRGRDVVAERSPLLGAGIKVRVLRPEGTEAPKEPEMVALTDERRAKIIAFVEANKRMPKDVRERILAQLAKAEVPARVVARIEGRMGG